MNEAQVLQRVEHDIQRTLPELPDYLREWVQVIKLFHAEYDLPASTICMRTNVRFTAAHWLLIALMVFCGFG
jgi:hypothetical protein